MFLSRLVKPNAVSQDLDGGIRRHVLAWHTELSAHLVGTSRRSISCQCCLGEVAPLLSNVLGKGGPIEIGLWYSYIENASARRNVNGHGRIDASLCSR